MPGQEPTEENLTGQTSGEAGPFSSASQVPTQPFSNPYQKAPEQTEQSADPNSVPQPANAPQPQGQGQYPQQLQGQYPPQQLGGQGQYPPQQLGNQPQYPPQQLQGQYPQQQLQGQYPQQQQNQYPQQQQNQYPQQLGDQPNPTGLAPYTQQNTNQNEQQYPGGQKCPEGNRQVGFFGPNARWYWFIGGFLFAIIGVLIAVLFNMNKPTDQRREALRYAAWGMLIGVIAEIILYYVLGGSTLMNTILGTPQYPQSGSVF